MATRSASVKGSSGIRLMDHHTDRNENAAPIMKAVVVTAGMLLSDTASLFMPNHTSSEGVR